MDNRCRRSPSPNSNISSYAAECACGSGMPASSNAERMTSLSMTGSPSSRPSPCAAVLLPDPGMPVIRINACGTMAIAVLPVRPLTRRDPRPSCVEGGLTGKPDPTRRVPPSCHVIRKLSVDLARPAHRWGQSSRAPRPEFSITSSINVKSSSSSGG